MRVEYETLDDMVLAEHEVQFRESEVRVKAQKLNREPEVWLSCPSDDVVLAERELLVRGFGVPCMLWCTLHHAWHTACFCILRMWVMGNGEGSADMEGIGPCKIPLIWLLQQNGYAP